MHAWMFDRGSIGGSRNMKVVDHSLSQTDLKLDVELERGRPERYTYNDYYQRFEETSEPRYYRNDSWRTDPPIQREPPSQRDVPSQRDRRRQESPIRYRNRSRTRSRSRDRERRHTRGEPLSSTPRRFPFKIAPVSACKNCHHIITDPKDLFVGTKFDRMVRSDYRLIQLLQTEESDLMELGCSVPVGVRPDVANSKNLRPCGMGHSGEYVKRTVCIVV
ncbi:hypothetical protein COOONC_05099 [Cooperia oncophora]